MGYVGIFWVINSEIKALKKRGKIQEFGLHIDEWKNINDTLPSEMKNESPYFYPRGRIIYNKQNKQYTIYINATLNTHEMLEKIKLEFNLQKQNIKIDSKDFHYNAPDIPILEPFDDF